jgi:hypothetical protein
LDLRLDSVGGAHPPARTRLFAQPQTRSCFGELLRVTGFAAAPGMFGVLGRFRSVGPLLLFAVSVWMTLATLVAVRQALDFSALWRALAVVVTGWAAYLLVVMMLGAGSE